MRNKKKKKKKVEMLGAEGLLDSVHKYTMNESANSHENA